MLTTGARIRWAMESMNLGKMDVSRMTDVPTYKLAKIMNDSTLPSNGELEKLCRVLGIPKEELM